VLEWWGARWATILKVAALATCCHRPAATHAATKSGSSWGLLRVRRVSSINYHFMSDKMCFLSSADCCSHISFIHVLVCWMNGTVHYCIMPTPTGSLCIGGKQVLHS
jgi:hypothetical protein